MKVIKKKKDDETEINYNITCKNLPKESHGEIQIMKTDFSI